MTLEEILKLEVESSSIKKIDLFLAEKKQTSYDYLRALSYKCLILHSLGKTQDALKALLIQTTHFKLFEDISVVSICDTLINIFIDIKNNEKVLTYIDIKKDHLEEIDKDEYIFDLIKYYDSTNNRIETKRNILIYLNYDIDESKQLYAYELLSELQYLDYEYDKFYNTCEWLEGYYKRNYKYDLLYNLLNKKANVYLKSNRYDDAIRLLKKNLTEDNISVDVLIEAASMLMDIYLKTDELKKAVIVESEYQELLDSASKTQAINFCTNSLELYTRLKNRISIDLYEEKLAVLQEEKKEIKKQRKSRINYDIVINEIEEVNKQEEKILEDYPTINITSNFKRIESVLNVFSNVGSIRFRDLLRNYGIEVEALFSQCEIVIVLKDEFKGFHYKKQRLYEKAFSDEQLIDTPLYELIDNSKRMFLLDVKKSLFNKFIITNKPYEEEFQSIIGFRLNIAEECLGSIVYHFFTDEFKDELVFENLKLLTNILNMNLNLYISEQRKSNSDKMREFIFSSTSNGIKQEIDHQIYLNEQAKTILGIDNDIDSNGYFSLIDSSDVNTYKQTLDKIYNYEIDKVILKYHMNNKYIKESIFVNRGSINEIYSIIEDVTNQETKENELIDLVYNNPVSKIPTRIKLYVDLENELEYKKFSLVLIDVQNFKLYYDIYGYNFSQELIYAIGKNLEEICDKYKSTFAYHLDGDKFAILFKNVNDIRLVSRLTKEILNKLSFNLNDLNKRLKVNFSAGIFRYVKNMSERNIEKLLSLTSDALLDAKEVVDEGNIVSIYNDQSSKKRFIESQIVLHVSEAIDNNLINLRYKQVVDINENMVDRYYVSLNLSNFTIEEQEFENVVLKRNLKELLDKYLIQHAISEIKSFYDNTSHYIRIVLPIYKTTLLSENFISFLDSKFDFFKVPSKLISFYIIEDSKNDILDVLKYFKSKYIKLISNNFDFTIRNKLDIYFCDINKYNNELVVILKKNCELLDIDVLAMGIDTLNDLDRCKELVIDSVYGNYFKKLFTIKELINATKENK